MPQRVELADKYGVPYDADNPVPTSASVDTTGLALEATQQDILTELQGQATSIPHFALDTATDLTRAFDDGSTAAEESLVAAVASQTTRVHRIIAQAAGACNIELRDGSAGTVLRKLVFPAAGAYVLEFDPRPYAKTTANTALYWYRSAAVACSIEIDYVTSA